MNSLSYDLKNTLYFKIASGRPPLSTNEAALKS
jgi:hypothetical protein